MTDASINIELKGNIFEAIKMLDGRLSNMESTASRVEKNTASSFSKITNALSVIKINQYADALAHVSSSFQQLNAPGMTFNKQMSELSAITGLTGNALDQVGDKARKNAKVFGIDAAQSVNSYKLILSQLTPELAKQPVILDKIAANAATLSKTMGGDLTGATEVITTAANQYGISLKNPIKAQKELADMMNVMAAASKEGSAELPQIKQAVEVAGMQAKSSGLSFAELNSQIQTLDKSGKKGAEGGTALRSVLNTLSKGRFLPKDVQAELENAGVSVTMLADKNVKFTDKMRALGPVLQKDQALINALFGEFGSSAAAMIQNANASDELTGKITGTNTAMEQANAIMQSTEEKQKRMQIAIDDAKISFFEATGGATAYMQPLAELGQLITGFAPLFSGASKAIDVMKKSKLGSAIASKVATAATWLWNVAMNANPVFLIITGVVALTGAVYAVTKAVSAGTSASRVDNDIKQKVIEKTAEQRGQLNQLFDTLRTTKVGSDEYNATLKELSALQPGIVEKYNLQAGAIKDINAASKEMASNIMAVAKAEAYKDKIKELYAKQAEEELSGPDWKDKLSAMASKGLSIATFGATKAYDANAFNRSDIKESGDDAAYATKKLVKLQNTKEYKNAMGVQGASDQTQATQTQTAIGSTTPTESTKPMLNTSSRGGSASFSGDSKEAKRIDVNFTNLVQNLTVQVNAVKDMGASIREQVAEALIGSVRDFENGL
jgi:TP901 family phage tail tape measure protein